VDAEIIRDLFRDFGPVDVRRMFGGVGVFVDGQMIALVTSDDVIYLKADGETVPAFEKEGLAPFSYATKNGEHTLTSYWRMPDRLYDDPEELARWARDAHAVALRKAAAKPRPRPAKLRPAKPRPAKRELGAAKRALRPAKRVLRPAKRAKKKH
jgi:DNA transformation protein and related proteins